MNISRIPTFSKDYINRFQNNGTGKVGGKKTDKSTTAEGSPEASEKKNTSSLPDGVVKRIQEMAKKDASKGIYMDDEFLAYNRQYMEKHISPDRSKLIYLLTPMLMDAQYTNGLPSFFQVPGLLFTGKLQVGALTGASMSIYDNNGTEILSYDNRNGWLSHQSKEESKYHSKTAAIYYKAFHEARTEMKANAAQGGRTDTVAPSNFNTYV